MKYIFKMLTLALVTITLTSSFQASKANYVYTVSLGAYVDAELSDFNDLRPIGYLYAKRYEDNLMQVFLGGYDTWASAKKVLPLVKERGYPDAFVTRRSLEEGTEVSTIQIGLMTAGEEIDWKNYLKAGNIHIAQVNNQIRILSGQYTTSATAKARLEELKTYGFKDAFVKTMNNAYLVKANSFETGGVSPDEVIVVVDTPKGKAEPEPKPEPEVIPDSYDVLFKKSKKEKPSTESSKGETTIPDDIPVTYDVVISPPKRVAVPMPSIRGKVKRTSAFELQKVLKGEQVYNSGLDGYYGKGTAAGYKKIKQTDRQIRKYLLLSGMMNEAETSGSESTLQKNVNELLENSTAIKELKASRSNLAKAYHAYYLFRTLGSSDDVDGLMNAAIKGAFTKNKIKNAPKFDYSATYAYKDLGQLLLHLQYIHAVTGEAEVPCWIFDEHPKEATEAFASSNENVKIQNCGGNFMDWEETKLLKTIAKDLDPSYGNNAKNPAGDKSKLAQLYLTPKELTIPEKKEMEAWHKSLWTAMEDWGNSDPVHDQRCTALKVAYFQSQVRLEDYFMDKGFNYKEAKPMAMAALKAMIGSHFSGYMKG